MNRLAEQLAKFGLIKSTGAAQIAAVEKASNAKIAVVAQFVGD
jgi:hypothetical protein